MERQPFSRDHQQPDRPSSVDFQLAKTTIPDRGNICSRPRLRHWFATGEGTSLWVSGPAGAGKTSAAVDYLTQAGTPFVWYTLDGTDRDPGTLYEYLVQTLSRQFGIDAGALPQQPPVPADPEVFFRRFFETFFASVPRPFTLVFDNYQAVPDQALWDARLRELLSLVPSRVRVFVLSRNDPPPVLLRFIAAGSLSTLGWEELRLDAPEVLEMARAHGLEITADQESPLVKQLVETAAGWPAAVALMVRRAARGQVTEPERLSAESQQEWFDYLAAEVFGTLDDSMRGLLLRVALLPTISTPVAAELCERPDAERVLTALCRQNLFMTRHGSSFRFHHLFRMFLLERGERSFSREELQSLRQRAAALLSQHGQFEQAVELLALDQDWSQIAELTRRAAPALAQEGRIATLFLALESLPQAMLRDDSWLSFWSGVCAMPRNATQALSWLTHAFQIFRNQGDAAGVYLSWATIIQAVAVQGDDFRAFNEWLTVLENLDLPIPSADIECRVAVARVMAKGLLEPGSPAHVEEAEAVYRLAHQVADPGAQAMAAGLAVLAYAMAGDGERASGIRARMQERVGLARDEWAELNYQHCNALAEWMAGDSKGCQTAVTTGLEIGEQIGVSLWADNLLVFGVMDAQSRGDLARAYDLVARLGERAEGGAVMTRANYAFLRGMLRRDGGDLVGAHVDLEEAVRVVQKVGWDFGTANALLVLANLFADAGDLERATATVNGLGKLSPKIAKLPLIARSFQLLEADISLQRDPEGPGRELLRATLVAVRGSLRSGPWSRAFLKRVATQALSAGIDPALVNDFLGLYELSPRSDLQELTPRSYRVSLRTFGHFELVIDDEPFRSGRKTPHSPLRMLKHLIALGGGPVGEGRLGRSLWTANRSESVFGTTLHRLRRLLALDGVLRFEHGEVSLDRNQCWVDAWALDALSERALFQLEGGEGGLPRPVDLERIADDLFELYRGPFLLDDESPSAILGARERYGRIATRIALALAAGWERLGKLDRAVELCERGIAIDDLWEALHENVVRLLVREKRTTEAAQRYSRWEETLWERLKVRPSERARALLVDATPAARP